jgi:hypothetical protein
MGLRDVPRFVRLAADLAQRVGIGREVRRELEEHGAAMRAAGKLG